MEIGSSVETVRNIATHQAVRGVQLLFLAPGKIRQMLFGQARSFSPNFSQAACRRQQTTLQTQCISWQACFPAENRLIDQSLGGAPNSATVGWAGSSLENVSIKKKFVVRRGKKRTPKQEKS